MTALQASVLADALHGFNHFLLKLFKGARLAEVNSLSCRILSKVLEVKSSLTVGEELDRGRLAALAKGIAERQESGVFSELPIHRGGMTDRPLTPRPRDPSTTLSRNVPLIRQNPAVLEPVNGVQTPSDTSVLNVLGESLVKCSCEPMTGWYRDGSCRTDPSDLGRHSVCCVMTEGFLTYSKAQGNDLSTPVPAFGFPGLQPGDHWCVCAPRWKQAYDDGMAPPVRLEATEASTLELIPLALLKQLAYQGID